MTDDSKPMEFWITDNTDNSGYSVETKFNHARHFGSCNVFHVIEKSYADALAVKLTEAEKEREMFIDRDRQSWEIRRDMHKENMKLKDQLTAERARSERLVQALFKVSLGHEYSCGTNEGCRCTCRAGIATMALAEYDAKGEK